jgi:5'(3')-deoxyribonucleotidase
MSNRTFTFFCGLPGSGKSTFIKQNGVYSKFVYYPNEFISKELSSPLSDEYAPFSGVLVSADYYKVNQSNYNPNEADNIHEDSVQWARNAVMKLIKETNYDILLDGGGINRSYNKKIISEIREFDSNIIIKCIFFDTPIDVCLKRISDRERKVPVDNIYEKNQRLTDCVHYYQENCDEFVRINYFTNKYAFIDMDGTICAYAKGKKDIDGNVDFVNGKHFAYLRPVTHIIEYLYNKYKDNLDNLYILTAVPNSIAWDEKLSWMEKNMPFVKKENILFVGNKDYKDVFLKHFMIGNKIDKKDVMMIDDNHDTLNKMIALGVNALHPSDINCLSDEYTIFG